MKDIGFQPFAPVESVLDNGMRVVTVTTPHREGASMAIGFPVGAVHEAPEVSGIGHLLEHVVFRGSTRRDGDALSGVFDRLGARHNACTDEDSVSFRAVALHEDMPTVIETMAEIVREPALDEEAIASEKDIIEQEACRSCLSCSTREVFHATAYPDQSLAQAVVGTEESMAAITRDDLAAHHARHYVGANACLVVVGAVVHEAIVAVSERAFGAMPRGEPTPMPRFTYAGGEQSFATRGDQGLFQYGAELWHGRSRETAAMLMFLDDLGGGPTSWLFRELREKRGLVYCASAWPAFQARHPLGMIEAQGDAKKIDEIFRIAIDTAHEAAERFDDAALERAQRSFRVSRRLATDSVYSIAGQLMFESVEFGTIDNETTLAGAVEALTPADVRETARAWLARPATLAAHAAMRHTPKLSQVARD